MSCREPWSLAFSDPPRSLEQAQQVVVASSSDATCQTLVELCSREGYRARGFPSPEGLLDQHGFHSDLLMLQVGLGDVDCFELCMDLRTTVSLRHAPILLVTDCPAPPNWTAAALLSGADDVCSLDEQHREELRARLRVQLRNKGYRDATVRLRAERNDLRLLARTDTLTGCLVRRVLESAVATELSAQRACSVLFVDIDRFKGINDRYGHQVGDHVLKRVARTLSEGSRQGDPCGRFGGEEFVLLLPKVTTEQARAIAERHRAAIERLRFDDLGGPDRVSISIGIASFDPEAPDDGVQALLHRADQALYAAKGAGRNRVELAPPLHTRSGTAPVTRV